MQKEIEMEELLPEWASRTTDEFELYAILPTKDGRVIGNAFIDSLEETEHGTLFSVTTDIGNKTKLFITELREWFHTPKYIRKNELNYRGK